MNPRILHVIPNRDFTMVLTFSNREVKTFDMKPYLDKGIFTTLKDWRKFAQARIAFGSVAWPGDLDISPDTLYLESTAQDTTSNTDCSALSPPYSFWGI